MTATILPNGKQQFIDINGAPLVDGKVYFYVPTTLIPKNTWQDADQGALNTNPVILDSRGQAVIYGTGSYRQVLQDSLGNEIWDKEIQSPLLQTEDVWVPTDDSGTGVGYSSVSGYYVKTGSSVSVYALFTVNANASSDPILTGSLPYEVLAGTFPTGAVNTDAGIEFIARAQSGTNTVAFLDSSNAPIAMSSVSGKIVGFSITYFTSE